MRVRAIMSDGYVLDITESWFVQIVARGDDWRGCGVVQGYEPDTSERPMMVNPQFITRTWVIGQAALGRTGRWGVSAAAGLRALADKATPGPWSVGWESMTVDQPPGRSLVVLGEWPRENEGNRAQQTADARLISLTPELARWAADAADVLDEYSTQCECGTCDKNAALLARLASLVGEEGA